METQDRRRSRRFRRLLRLEFDYDEKHATCVSTDVSCYGTFVNSQVVPPVGYWIELVYRPGDDARQSVLMRGRVARIVHQTLRASRIPGIAVAFEEVACVGGGRPLVDFLSGVLGYEGDELTDDRFSKDAAGYTVFRVVQPSVPESPAAKARADALSHERTLPLDERQSVEVLDQLHHRKERRRNPRYPVNVDLSFYVGEIPFLGSVVNISRTSLFIQTDHKLPAMGTQLNMKYPLAEAPDPQYVRIDGTVCRHWNPQTERLQGFAIHFDHVGELGRPGLFHTYLTNFQKARSSGSPRRGFHYSMHKR